MKDLVNKIDWDKTKGLIPAIVQDYKSGDVLMLGYMNKEALLLTLETKKAHYYSRSREKLWLKGESSGHFQNIKDILLDCDNDTLLLKVEQVGVACHTGRKSCFFQDLLKGNITQDVQIDMSDKYSIVDRVYHTICERKNKDKNKSYVAKLFDKGINTILKKVSEEAGEFIIATKDKEKNEIIYEATDLLFHVLVALCYMGISPELIKNELKRREGISGIEEKNSRVK